MLAVITYAVTKVATVDQLILGFTVGAVALSTLGYAASVRRRSKDRRAARGRVKARARARAKGRRAAS
ncbi:hypothetical protein OG352_18195 [Streptomyces sp. NBC_01485]|uniref:hypothetical protein n=1 Tax=Streptomyces sp. NBC_01485 TaxID=2903884 RepID=UPI002E380E8E|nr:hypothetical protein [Streptomyces sp. NBC_01485]